VAGSRVPDCVNAAVDSLKADADLIGASLLGSAKVYTHVPQGTTTPYVFVIGGDEVPWVETMTMDSLASPGVSDGGDSGGRAVDIVTQCVSTSRGSSEVDGIASRVLEVLTDPDNWTGVAGFQIAQFIRNAAQPPIDLNSDGVLWFVRFVTVRVFLV
jgi:hypothetical protein